MDPGPNWVKILDPDPNSIIFGSTILGDSVVYFDVFLSFIPAIIYIILTFVQREEDAKENGLLQLELGQSQAKCQELENKSQSLRYSFYIYTQFLRIRKMFT